MEHKSMLLLRTRSAQRIFARLSQGQRARLAGVEAELNLIEQLLNQVNRASDVLFESVVLEVLEAALYRLIEAIGAEIGEAES